MKNHIIFWNKGKAITLALLVAAGYVQGQDESRIPVYGTEAPGAIKHYVYIEADNKYTVKDYTVEPEKYDYIWYEETGVEVSGEGLEYGAATPPEADIEKNFKNVNGTAITLKDIDEPGMLRNIQGLFYNNKKGAIHLTNSSIGNIGGFFAQEINTNDAAGSAIVVEDSSVEKITGHFLNHGKVAQGGAAIYSVGSKSEIGSIDGVFVANRSTSGESYGGAIYNAEESSIGEITGEFLYNYGSKGGGAIYNDNAEIGVISGVFKHNRVEYNTYAGGALYNTNGATIGEITDCDFSDNYAGNGSAIYNAAAGVIDKITGSSFAHNTGGAALYNEGASIGSISDSQFYDNKDGYAIHNRAGAEISSLSAEFTNNADGAVRNEGASIGEIHSSSFKGNSGNAVNNGIIWSNTAAGDITYVDGVINSISAEFSDNKGHAIWNDGASIGEIKDSKFCNTEGYAIFNKWATTSDGSVSVSGRIDSITAAFSGNTSGDIYNLNSEIGQLSGTFDGSGISGDHINRHAVNNEASQIDRIGEMNAKGEYTSLFTGNSNGDRGGAIFNTSSLSTAENGAQQVDKEAVIGSIAAKFEGNSSAYGGAIYNNYARIGSISGSFTGNYTTPGAYGDAGGALTNDNQSTIKSIDAEFTSNYSQGSGGAIINNSDSQIEYIGGSFNKNGVKDAEVKTDLGGAIANSLSEIGQITADFEGNQAIRFGGAIYNYGTIGSISGGSYTENKAGDSGGAVYNGWQKSISSISGGVYEKNEAGGSGGVIYNEYEASIGSINEGEYSENAAGKQGGVIWNNGAIGSISAGVYCGNSANEEGGAIYNYGTIGSVSGGVYKENRAGYGGGAIYNGLIMGDIVAESFEGNVAEMKDNFGGGAIYNADTISSITAKEFKGNTAGFNGGAIANLGWITGNIVVDSFEGNVSLHGSRGGGAIYNGIERSIAGNITIQKLYDNVVGQKGSTEDTSGGGGIANYGTIGDIYIGEAKGNISWRHNGGVISNGTIESVNSYAVIGVISGESFHDNYAFGSGGAIHNEGVGAVIAGIDVSVFSNNISCSSGGAVRNYKGASLTSGVLYSDFTGNYALNRAGALYYEGYLSKLTGNYIGNEAYNDGGAICFAEAGSVIDEVTAVFKNNRAGVYREEEEGWKEIIERSPTISNGGAILNGFRYVSLNMDEDGNRSDLQAWIDRNEAEGADEDGNEYYILRGEGSKINKISKSSFSNNTAGYTETNEPSPSASSLGSGGAIANGYIDHLIREEVGDSFNFWIIARGEIGEITETSFTDNAAIYRGGAVYNARGSIGSIDNTEFTGNRAYREVGDGYGGAIFNNKSSTIGSISKSLFSGNVAGADGGAIYNESVGVNGSIGSISESRFTGNSAVGGAGGAIYNVGYIKGIRNTDFSDNAAAYQGTALANVGEIGEISDDASAENSGREYDNTIVDGLFNTSFTHNTSAQDDGQTAALYTETDLALIAEDGHHILFDQNTVGVGTDAEKESDIFVKTLTLGQSPDFYMISQKGGAITTNGIINGNERYVLRLRGYMERVDGDVQATHDYDKNSGGHIYFNGLVINADAIMDDVTLHLGLDPDRSIDKNEAPIAVYDDTIAHRRDGLLIEAPKIDFKGEKGDVELYKETYGRTYSDVLRHSHLEARSGNVTSVDDQIANYNIGVIESNGRMSYLQNPDQGYYNKGLYAGQHNENLYATWSVDIDMATQKSDSFTTWYREGEDKKEQSRGFMTLSGCTFRLARDGAEALDPYDHQHSKDDYVVESDFLTAYPDIDRYYDVNIQVINLIWKDKNGKADESYIPEEWKTEAAPLQLDLGELKQTPHERAYMTSNDLLCEGIGYGTTKTYHDSMHIWGWRDNLAAWSELQENDAEQGDKKFTIINNQLLTRNIKRYESETLQDRVLLQEKRLTIIGASDHDLLDVGGYNLLSEVAKGQTLELNNLRIVHVGTGDTEDRTYQSESIWQKIQNDGTLILDTLEVDADLAVMNDSESVKRGDWGIYNIFTSHQRSEVDLTDWTKSEKGENAPDAIDNVLRLQNGYTYITGTIEYNNVSNEKAAETYLTVHESTDYRRDNGDTRFADPADATGAFQRFFCNSLSMADGNFYLINLNASELKLRDLHIGDGSIHINSVTVDLEKEDMGRVWAYGNATYDGTGHIIVQSMDALVVKPKDGASDEAHYIERDGKKGYEIPVRFVNKGVAASVIPFGVENDYADADRTRSRNYEHAKEGELYWYEVDYSYETGYYYYRRWLDPATGQSEIVPSVQVGPVAQAAGAVGSMQQVNAHAFEHADLFSDSVYRAQKERLYERAYTVVTTMKGKNSAKISSKPAASAKRAGSCSGLSGFKGGLWVRPYAAYEKLPLSRGPKVTNNLYGAVVGGDSDLNEHRNGWASVFSAHAAYLGSTQRYSMYDSHVRVHQNGGAIGATETLYRRDFYTALSATIGTSAGHASTSVGTENFHMLLGSVASRSGYNFFFGKGRYVLQPTLMLSYTMASTQNYTNAAGTRVTSSPVHMLQLHPYMKFIISTESCWTPYISLGYVHNFMGKTHFRANGVKMPEMSTEPYAEYGLGIQKTWADTYTIFGELTGRSGGRNGVEFSAGLRWSW